MIEKVNYSTSLQLEFYLGEEGGKEKKRRKTYGDIKENATTEDLHAVARAIATLQKHTLSTVYLNERNQLVEA